jgi:isopenicillin N synthase-like dioxygenase
MPATTDLNQRDPVQGAVDTTSTFIDYSDIEFRTTAATSTLVRQIATTHGFLGLRLNRRQRESLNSVLSQLARFSALEDDSAAKAAIRNADEDYGWSPQFSEPAYQPGTISSLESFDVGKQHVGDTANPIWPDLPGFAEDAQQCWSDFAKISDRVLDLLARSLGIVPSFFSSQCDSHELDTFRMLHYASSPEGRDDKHVGIAAHTDFECITLLYQSAPGLEILGTDGSWLDVPSADNRLIVLFGDMLERWSNGEIYATGHRVRETRQQRFSLVMFVAANKDATVKPLDCFVAPGKPAAYKAIKQEEHIANEMARAHENARQANTK